MKRKDLYRVLRDNCETDHYFTVDDALFLYGVWSPPPPGQLVTDSIPSRNHMQSALSRLVKDGLITRKTLGVYEVRG